MIDGRTQFVGLLGWPVAHSLSPLMHNAAFEALGLAWRYVPLPVQPGQVAEAVRGLAALGFRGANVTVPHKQAVLPVLDRLAPEAETLGAVNTLVIRRQEGERPLIEGHNTDARGFLGALARGGFDLAGEEPAIVVGAGGAARAVVAGLLSQGRRKVWVLNRTVEKAQALASALDPARVEAVPFTSEVLVDRARAAGLLVNATTVGMVPAAEASIWPEGVPVPHHLTVFDLVYTPLETRLLQQARAGGARALDGLEMLVQQGALAFTLWVDVDLEVNEVARLMRAACSKR
jgi:shikimate dehydrogenase